MYNMIRTFVRNVKETMLYLGEHLRAEFLILDRNRGRWNGERSDYRSWSTLP